MIDALVAVGRDCDCGHPLVWRDGIKVCAVYGLHTPRDPGELLRDTNAYAAALIDELVEMTPYRGKKATT